MPRWDDVTTPLTDAAGDSGRRTRRQPATTRSSAGSPPVWPSTSGSRCCGCAPAFMVAAVMGGFGVSFYAGLWMVLPADAHFDDEAPGLGAAAQRRAAGAGPPARRLRPAGRDRRDRASALRRSPGPRPAGAVFWPVVLGVAGVALLWRQADEAQRERWLDSSGPDQRRPRRRSASAAARRTPARCWRGSWSCITLALRAQRRLGARRATSRSPAILCFIGLGFIVGPWLFRLSSDLGEERAERIRSQERADVAAHLHDSVLQTLALIQKSAQDPATVARLARAQERDLRSWLFDSASRRRHDVRRGAARRSAGEVDDAYGVPVEVVCVGDSPVSEQLRPIVLATREAVANAAEHSGAEKVDVYAEATPARVEVFVRDRGAGSTRTRSPPTGTACATASSTGCERHGGSAEVRSRPGEGTEVRLTCPNP